MGTMKPLAMTAWAVALALIPPPWARAQDAMPRAADGRPDKPVRPQVLDRPLDPARPTALPAQTPPEPTLLRTPTDRPLGAAGPSGILPREEQEDSHFVPVEDRWRVGFPQWERSEQGHGRLDDTPYVEGNLWNPYRQNVLKGDYPLVGQYTFLNLTGISRMNVEGRSVPTPANGFESTARPGEFDQFGKPDQFFYSHNFALTAELFHGDAAYKPADWRLRLMPVFNINYLDVEETGVVSPDVRKGTDRGRSWLALEEWFAEAKLADLSPNYDFVSVRAGSQPFTSDFRGFLFSDTNRAVRLFGTRLSNRDQFNLVYFSQQEKDTNSGLNTFSDRHQDIVIANYYRQDFLFPGYTAQASLHYNHDSPTTRFDKNGFLVRPDPAGVFQPHSVDVAYLGWAGDGHIDRVNVTHQVYWALGRDSLNPIANQRQDISAWMTAAELSYDRDWMRFRTSFLWASGDDDPSNSHATGFDTILDNPNFAGGDFTYWQRQQIKLLGVNLVQRESLVPDLRSSKIQGQSNFVNPGLFLANFGVDFELTPRWKMVNNVNLLWFDETEVLETFLFQGRVHHFIGTDVSSGFEYRPLLSNNAIVRFGLAGLVPGRGFSDIYDNLTGPVRSPLLSGFLEMTLAF